MNSGLLMIGLCGCVVLGATALAQEPARPPPPNEFKMPIDDVYAAKKRAVEKMHADRMAAEKAKNDLKRQDFNTDNIADAIKNSKSPDVAKSQPPSPPPAKSSQPGPGTKAEPRVPSTADAALLVAVLKRQVQRCWNIDTSQPASAKPPLIRFRLTRNGLLGGEPQVVNTDPSVSFQTASNAVLRALKECQPYALPADLFEWWKEVELAFDARQIVR
jgi:colicin import membrane protein